MTTFLKFKKKKTNLLTKSIPIPLFKTLSLFFDSTYRPIEQTFYKHFDIQQIHYTIKIMIRKYENPILQKTIISTKPVHLIFKLP